MPFVSSTLLHNLWVIFSCVDQLNPWLVWWMTIFPLIFDKYFDRDGLHLAELATAVQTKLHAYKADDPAGMGEV